jgi:GNAT superfamily N-acetyltransferase
VTGVDRRVDSQLELAEAAAFGDLCDTAGLPALRIAGATCYASPALPRSTMLNRVVGLGLAGPVADGTLDDLEEFFRSLGAVYAVSISPAAEPSLPSRLEARGFSTGYSWMKFRRDLSPPRPVETSLEVAATDDGIAFGSVVGPAYGLPDEAASMFSHVGGRRDWHLFLAYDDGEPVGGAALFAREGVGWLGAAATLPEQRGRGAQGALLAARIARGRELGLSALTTETGERLPDRPSNSYRNILRAGFEEAYLRPNLVAPT